MAVTVPDRNPEGIRDRFFDNAAAARTLMGTSTNQQQPYVQQCDDGAAIDVHFVGGKFSGLCKLKKLGFDVPNSICVTTRLFAEVLDTDGACDYAKIDDWSPVDAFDDLGLSILKNFLKQPSISGSEDAVFIRSSATAEDQTRGSFAGQFVSLVGPRSLEFVSEGIRECFVSFFAPHVGVYARARQIDLQDQAMAVVLQDAVPADASGVIFTEDPVLGPDFARIEASVGLGGPMMSGLITPDSFVVSLATGITQKRIGSKRVRHTLKQGGRVEISVTGSDEAKRLSLDDHLVTQLIELGRTLASSLGAPQDIEFAISGERIFLLQTRPITTSKRA
jgi:phosphoenolpyruvate synthase/pyruvate phosphate dikinase